MARAEGPRLLTGTAEFFSACSTKFTPAADCLSGTGWTCSGCTTPKLAGLSPDVSSVPEPKTMGYAFDDGPNCTHNAFYNYLASQNQKATMFYIGSNVMDWPLQAQRAIADGHEICARECPACNFLSTSELIVVRVSWQTLGHIVTVSFFGA
jgi:hypothetical protein